MKELKKFTRVEKYNACPRCGGEVSLYVDDDGDYRIGCPECNGANVGPFFSHYPTQYELELCRPIWNIQALGDTYSQKVLDQLGIQNGDYVVSDTRDNYIVFAGNAEEMIRFVFEELQSERELVFDIHQHLDGKLFALGKSYLLEIAWRHPMKQNKE